MTDNLITAVVGILTAVIGVAIIAALLSNKSQTSQVIQAGSQGFEGILSTALGPITGAVPIGSSAIGGSNNYLAGFQQNELSGVGL